MRTRRSFLALATAATVAGCQGQRDETTNDAPLGADLDSVTTDEPVDSRTDAPGREHVAWTASFGGTVTQRPTGDGDRLFVGTAEGTLAALDAADGQSRWTYDAGDPIQVSPVVGGDTVVTVTGEDGVYSSQTVHAVAADSGDGRWQFAPTDWWLDIVGVGSDTAYVATTNDAVGSTGQSLYALALDDGSERWSVEVGDPSGGFVADDRVYVPSAGAVDAVDRDGTVAWRYEIPEYQYRTLSVVGDTVALVSADDPRQPTVHGIDAATGETSWTRDDLTAYTTAAVGDRLLAGGESVVSLDPMTGETLWSADVTATLYDPPHADGTIYAAGDEAAAVSLADGRVTWRTALDSYLARAVGLLDGTLVVQASESQDNRNRHIRAFETADGEQAWSFTGDAGLTRLAFGSGVACAGEDESVLALTP